MTKKKPITVIANKHTSALVAAASYYARAAARYRIDRHHQAPKHITRVRFLEAASYLDAQLSALVLRSGPKGRTLTTATQAARIKAAAHHLADLLAESGTTPDLCPRAAYQHLVQLIGSTLQQREAEDTTKQAHPVTLPQRALAA